MSVGPANPSCKADLTPVIEISFKPPGEIGDFDQPTLVKPGRALRFKASRLRPLKPGIASRPSTVTKKMIRIVPDHHADA